MRPLELAVEGFKSYPEEQVFTFDGRSLFGIVGPTGAGKSTILEAMMYALYGKTHREQRDTRDLIRTGAEAARVRLAFEVDTGAWVVIRVLRRKQPSQAVLTRLGSDRPEAMGQTAVTARIEELVGLDFAAFCSSVILPQGEFDKFLMATGGERSKILKGIFRLDRVDAIRERAKHRLGGVNEQIVGLRGEARALPADPARLGDLRIRLAAARERAEAIRAELGVVLAAERTLEQQQAELDELRRRAEGVEVAFVKIPAAGDLEALAAVEREHSAAVERTGEALAAARTSYQARFAQLEAAREHAGGSGALGQARECDALRRRAEEGIRSLEAEQEAASATAAAATAEAGSCSTRAAADAEVVAGVEAHLREAQQQHAAHVLRASLHPGDACPVCEQVVAAIPATPAPEALGTAEGRLRAARAAADQSAALLNRAHQALAVATEAQRSASARLDRGRSDHRDALAKLHALLGPVDDPTAEIARRASGLEAATEAESSARSLVARAEEARAMAVARAEEAARRRRGVAAALTELSGPLGFPPPDIEGGVSELERAAVAAHQAASALRKANDDRRAAIVEEARRASEVLGSFRTRFGLRPQEGASEALAETMTGIGSVTSEIDAVEQAIVRADEIEKEVGGLAAEAALYERLVADMTNHRLTAYLLDADRRLLATLGSEKLFELTAGRYRFDDDGRFEIVEARSDGRRAAGTLSGGETFLASLALALALAEAVSRTGGRLGCFFLDEGFGSLDSESLDLALEGIESLAGPGRLIGLISHVGQLQARLEDLIVLDKAEDGSTVVVQTEGQLSYPAALI